MRRLIIISLAFSTLACTQDIPQVSLGIDSFYRIARMQKLDLHPEFTGSAYRWYVDGREVADTRDYIFMAATEGTYELRYEVIDDTTPFVYDFTVEVTEEQEGYSPYISTVYEYCPAPGQFVNEMPRYDEGDTAEDMRRKAEESISGTNDIMISLGSFGGYVTFGFDHTVVNVPGEKDIRIWGNAFFETTSDDGRKGGSSEPGTVWVSYDANCNGLPDDEWYELAGSEYRNPLTLHNYSITYNRPDPDREIVSADGGQVTDARYIAWSDSQGESSWLPKNMFHTQDYFPKWLDVQSLTFTGTRLPQNAVDAYGDGSYYILFSYPWGYVDNFPNSEADLNSFDIGWAVDAEGQPVDLPGVDFVRVVTGMNQYCGWLGESSTEICRAQDLHISDPLAQ